MSEAPTLDGLTVLVAEDHAVSREVTAAMLSRLGASVLEAGNGLTALEIVREARPDLILLDLEMPEMSGLDVLQVLAGDASAPPVLCLTGHTEREYVLRVTELGAAGLIEKPILRIDDLGTRVRAALGGRDLPARADRAAAGALDHATFRALAQMMGPEMIRRVVAQMETDLSGAIRQIDAAVRAQDFAAARAAAHVLVSVAGSVGARDMVEGARAISAHAQRGDADGMERAAAPLAVQLDRVLDAISTELEGR